MVPPLRILHIEDNPADARLLEDALTGAGHRVVSRLVSCESELVEALGSEWDVVLADHGLSKLPGPVALRIVRELAPDLPFLFVAGDMGEDAAVEALRAGAQDCLGRRSLQRLVTSVERELWKARLRRDKALAERRFEDLTRTMSDVYWVAGRAPAPLEYVSPAAEAIWGRPVEDLMTLDGFLSTVHPEDREKIEEVWRRQSLGEVTEVEFRVVRSDGTQRWLLDRAYPVRDSQGMVLRTNGLVVDITERKRSEAALQESEARLSGLIASAMDAILTVDEEMRVMLFNGAAERMFGRSVEEVRGRRLEELIRTGWGGDRPADLLPPGQNGLISRVMGPMGSLTGIRSNGEEFPVEASVSQTVVGGERLLTVILRDVTERRQADSARTKLEAQLRQSQKLEAIGALAGGIAHDFNNVLGAILGHAELLQLDLPPGSPGAESVAEILKAARRSSEVVRQMLTFSRRQDQPRGPLDLALVVKEACKFLRASIPVSIDIEVKISSSVPQVLGDPGQLHQVLMNLATNSRQAMEGRNGRMSIGLHAVDVDATMAQAQGNLAPGRYVRLSVTDTGVGMDAATLDRLFEPFFTTKGPRQGAGLGLAVVHGIVRSHGGGVTVYSQPGQGTTFHVFIPALVPKAAEVVAEPPLPARGRGERILYVDDEIALAKVADRMLRSMGYEVTFFTRPTEALAALATDPMRFQLVIADLTMPGMSGLELARRVREIRYGMPFLLTTGYHGTEDTGELSALGIAELLTKPVNTERLAKAVRGVLDVSQPAQSESPVVPNVSQPRSG
jgi:PAS domain S-box-containing protein